MSPHPLLDTNAPTGIEPDDAPQESRCLTPVLRELEWRLRRLRADVKTPDALDLQNLPFDPADGA